jgi:hypothetical protein
MWNLNNNVSCKGKKHTRQLVLRLLCLVLFGTMFSCTSNSSPTLVGQAVLPSSEGKLLHTEYYSVEKLNDSWTGWENSSSLERAKTGKVSCKIGFFNLYSVTYHSLIDSNASHIQVEAALYAESTTVKPKLVIDLQNENNQSISYHLFELQQYLQKEEWFHLEVVAQLVSPFPANSKLVVYFWYPDAADGEALFIDDISIRTYQYQ